MNPKHLTLARQTVGSINTIEEDIIDLININESETIIIGDEKFRIRSGEFMQVLD